jgi:tetratricopeptide (TPR) repeat protein
MRRPKPRWRAALASVTVGVVAVSIVVGWPPVVSAQEVPYVPPRASAEQVDATLLATWVEAVERHEPGVLDSSLLGAARWSSGDLRRLWADVQVLVQLASEPKKKRFRAASVPDPSRRWRENVPIEFARSSDRVVVEALAERIRVVGMTPTLKRAALVHTDVATLAADLAADSTAPTTAGASIKTLVGDGARAGTEGVSLHWSLARMLLSRLAPHPRDHAFVRDWYRATLAVAQSTEFWDAVHLDHALDIFPHDPILLLFKGAQHEAYAAPLYQQLMRGFHGQRVRPDISDADAELDRAEKAFRSALAGDPSLAEAQVRLGRVLALDGQRESAIRELDQAIARGLEPVLEYYARLFLGAEHQAGGDLAAARAQFRRAAELEPKGRVPFLALAQIARELGDRDDMHINLDRALASPSNEAPTEPWWTYRVSQARRAEAWLEAVRRSWNREAP